MKHFQSEANEERERGGEKISDRDINKKLSAPHFYRIIPSSMQANFNYD